MRDERNKPQPLDLNKWLRFKSSILTNRVLLPVLSLTKFNFFVSEFYQILKSLLLCLLSDLLDSFKPPLIFDDEKIRKIKRPINRL